MTRRAGFALVALVCCASLALWWSLRADGRGPVASLDAAAASPVSAAAPASRTREPVAAPRSALVGGEDPAFAALPAGERPEAMRDLASDLAAWLLERSRASLDAELHPVDCSAPPCLLIIDYDAAVGGDDFVERVARQLPELRAMAGLQYESQELPHQRRRAFFYYADPATQHPLIAAARARIAGGAAGAPALAAVE